MKPRANFRSRLGSVLRRGALGLVLLAMAIAVVRVAFRGSKDAGDTVVIRVAHTNLQPGAREAYDALIARYEALHPGVRVEQISVPIRVYASWLQTQLVGETAPDVIEIRHGQRNEFIARFFVPLTRWVQEPNPYNEGTPLAGIRWRNTFVDGLQNDPNYFRGLLDYYAIPGTLRTYRLVANLDLLEQIAGHRRLPRDHAELMALCAQAQAWRDPLGRRIEPIAAGGWAGFQLLDRAFRRETQELEDRLDRTGQLTLNEEEVAALGLRGEWSPRSPEVTAGLERMRALGLLLPAGFWSLPVGDVHFQFLQGRALFVVASSQEMTALRESATFPTGVTPAPDAPRSLVLDPANDVLSPRPDPMAEGNVPTMASLGITRQSRHQEQALDFLRFISSYEGNRHFSERSGWMPAVIDVPEPAGMEAFTAELAGSPPGFSLWLVNAEVHFRLFVNLHHLISLQGSVGAFQDVIEPFYANQLAQALRTDMRVQREASARLDPPLAARAVRDLLNAASDPSTPHDAQRRRLLDESQASSEARTLRSDNAIATHASP
jgi:raffinose/stachyose/melibiose transport system substrate-binding protein